MQHSGAWALLLRVAPVFASQGFQDGLAILQDEQATPDTRSACCAAGVFVHSIATGDDTANDVASSYWGSVNAQVRRAVAGRPLQALVLTLIVTQP